MFQPNTKCIARIGQEGITRPVEIIGPLPMGLCTIFQCRDLETSESLLVPRDCLMLTQSIPSRYKRSLFDRFAPVLGYVLRKFPVAVPVDPKPLSVETYAARFRDAKKAKQLYGYKHPEVDEVLFEKHAPDITTAMHDGKVFIGSRESVRAALSVAVGEVLTPVTATIAHEVGVGFSEQLCFLIDRKAFNPQPQFVIVGLTPEQATSLEQRYDVGLHPTENDPNKWYII
jgi:hypothetical protein